MKMHTLPAAAGAALVMALGLAVAVAGCPSRLSAQTVAGAVVTEDGGIPVAGAHIWLFRADETPVDSVWTDASGRFRLRASSSGTYMLYVKLRGYASETSTTFKLAAGQVLQRNMQVRLVSVRAMQIMGKALDRDTMLQRHLPELCGEPPRPWETGFLVGIIRDRPTGKPLPGAVVMVQPPATADSTPRARTKISNPYGTYVFCNIPPGDSVLLRVRARGYRTETETVRVRLGMIGWYDVYMYRKR